MGRKSRAVEAQNGKIPVNFPVRQVRRPVRIGLQSQPRSPVSVGYVLKEKTPRQRRSPDLFPRRFLERLTRAARGLAPCLDRLCAMRWGSLPKLVTCVGTNLGKGACPVTSALASSNSAPTPSREPHPHLSHRLPSPA